jgi:H+-transporting ATPase
VRCSNSKKEAVEEAVANYGGRGIRTLAVAHTKGDDDYYNFAALITFLDPPRPDTKSTIHRVRRRRCV